MQTESPQQSHGELTDMQIMEIFDGKDFCADDYTPWSMEMYEEWFPRIRAVIAADRALLGAKP